MMIVLKNVFLDFSNGISGMTYGSGEGVSSEKKDVYISDGKVAFIVPSACSSESRHFRLEKNASTRVFNFNNCFVFPGFTDVHVHFRQPGFLYKETVATGSAAAAHGGYTTVCAMPNLNPVPDSRENLAVELDAIRRDARVRVLPYGAITVGERGEVLSDMEGIASDIVAFSDDGRGVESEELMLEAMKRAKRFGKIIAAHCEDRSLLHGGYIHDGEYAKAHGHRGICSESEWGPIKRDLKLAAKTGCSYHICHVSTKESVALIREAKAAGIDVTAETAPHYLLLTDADLMEDGRYKMNPPLRAEADRQALLEGICDGTIDMIATDHAPHSVEEKSRGLRDSLMGIVGLETAFPLLYTALVKSGTISLGKLTDLMSAAPDRRFGISPGYTGITEGMDANLCVYNLNKKYNINVNNFSSLGRSTPFDGREVSGWCRLTVYNGGIVWNDEEF